MAAESTRKILALLLKISTSFKCIPFEWDGTEGRLTYIRSRTKRLLAYVNAFAQFFYGAFIGVSMVHRLVHLEQEEVVVYELLLHGIYTISFVSPAIYTLNMVFRPRIFQDFVNSFLNFHENHEALLMKANEYHGRNKYLNFLLLSFARGTFFNVTMLAFLFLENPMRPHYLFAYTGFSKTCLPMIVLFTVYECCMGFNGVVSFFVILFFMLCHLDATKFWLHQITNDPQNIRLSVSRTQTMVSKAASTGYEREKSELQSSFTPSTMILNTGNYPNCTIEQTVFTPRGQQRSRTNIKNALTVKVSVAAQLQAEDLKNLEMRMQFHIYKCLQMLNNRCNEAYRDVVLVVFISACFLAFVCSAYTTIRTFGNTPMPAYLISPGLWGLCLNLQVIFQSSAGEIYKLSKNFRLSMYMKASRKHYVRKRLESLIPLQIFVGYYYYLQKKTLLLFLMLASTQTMSVLIAF